MANVEVEVEVDIADYLNEVGTGILIDELFTRSLDDYINDVYALW